MESEPRDTGQPDTGQARDTGQPGDTGGDKVANHDEVTREFAHGENTSLREQADLTDADGDDIREYTGEPVETEHGTVIPQQMAVGAEQVVGGGEFPNTPGRADDGTEGEPTDGG